MGFSDKQWVILKEKCFDITHENHTTCKTVNLLKVVINNLNQIKNFYIFYYQFAVTYKAKQ